MGSRTAARRCYADAGSRLAFKSMGGRAMVTRCLAFFCRAGALRLPRGAATLTREPLGIQIHAPQVHRFEWCAGRHMIKLTKSLEMRVEIEQHFRSIPTNVPTIAVMDLLGGSK